MFFPCVFHIFSCQKSIFPSRRGRVALAPPLRGPWQDHPELWREGTTGRAQSACGYFIGIFWGLYGTFNGNFIASYMIFKNQLLIGYSTGDFGIIYSCFNHKKWLCTWLMMVDDLDAPSEDPYLPSKIILQPLGSPKKSPMMLALFRVY